MAKKVRRVRRSGREAKGSSRSAPTARSRQTTVDDLREEYAYVLRDLRRVFYLAVAMFALLIALNLFLR